MAKYPSHKSLLQKTRPDDLFIVSYPKSGCTWLRYMIGNYMTGNQCNFGNLHSIMPGLRHDQESIDWSKSRPRFVQSHFPFNRKYPKVVYVIRDGRDVAVSLYYHLIKNHRLEESDTFMDFLPRFAEGEFSMQQVNWSEHVCGWLENPAPNTMVVRYEDMLNDPVKELERVLAFAGETQPDEAALVSAVEASSIDSMRNSEKKDRDKSLLAKSRQDMMFVRKGKSGDWQNHFDDAALELFMQTQAPGMDHFEHNHSEDGFWPLTPLKSDRHGKGHVDRGAGNIERVLLTGLPRSGTTLTSHIFSEQESVISINEPVTFVKDFAEQPDDIVVARLNAMFDSVERDLKNGDPISMPSAVLDGETATNTFDKADDGSRTFVAENKALEHDKRYEDVRSIIMKKPVMFTALLPQLVDDFKVYGVIRNPLPTLISWLTIDNIKEAKWADTNLVPDLRDVLGGLEHEADRLLTLLSWYYQSYELMLPPERIIRYEEITQTQGRCLESVSGEKVTYAKPVENLNDRIHPTDLQNDAINPKAVAQTLLDTEGAYWLFYSKDSVASIAKSL